MTEISIWIQFNVREIIYWVLISKFEINKGQTTTGGLKPGVGLKQACQTQITVQAAHRVYEPKKNITGHSFESYMSKLCSLHSCFLREISFNF